MFWMMYKSYDIYSNLSQKFTDLNNKSLEASIKVQKIY